MIWRVKHVTAYAYGAPVDTAIHLLHLSPRAMERQSVRHAALVSEPAPSRRERGPDHFGNDTAWLYLDRPHTRFVVTAESVVEVRPPPPRPAVTPAWETIAALAREAPDVAEFLFPSPMLPPVPEARDHLLPSFPPGRPALQAMEHLTEHFRDHLAFRPGATTISTPVAEVLKRRAGVCQDFAHLMITGLRMLGIPARYVSGYIRTRPPPGGVRRLGADQSHAWVAAWLGPEAGWVEVDPTNRIFVAEEHVIVAWGRDFGDVSPLRGIILGGGKHAVTVGVDMEPVGEPAG